MRKSCLKSADGGDAHQSMHPVRTVGSVHATYKNIENARDTPKTSVLPKFKVLSSGYLSAQWLSGRVIDSRPKGRRFEPHQRHCVVSLSKNINPSLVLVQPRKTRPFITERLLMGRKESNQTNKQDLSVDLLDMRDTQFTPFPTSQTL